MTTNILTATKANSLYWLGRYEERVYITLHLLRKCYDRMIDGEMDDYSHLWTRLDTASNYQTVEEFSFGMMYDESNPSSVLSAQTKAMDNAILLRENIRSETLSYLEMSIALLKACKERQETNVTALQSVTDWSLAFWGSAEQRLRNHRALYLMMLGRNVENLDMLIRFEYPYERIALAYDSLKRYTHQMASLIDEHMEGQLNSQIVKERFNLSDIAYKNQLLAFLSQLVRV